MGVGCAGLGLRGVLLSAACLGLFAAAPTEKPLKFGPEPGMEQLHGVLMHGDDAAGADHAGEDAYLRLQAHDAERAAQIRDGVGPCAGEDCAHALLHGDGEGVQHMEQRSTDVEGEKREPGPQDAMAAHHGLLMHDDGTPGADHQREHDAAASAATPGEEQAAPSVKDAMTELHGVLMHGDAAGGEDHAREDEAAAAERAQGPAGAGGGAPSRDVQDPHRFVHDGDADPDAVHSDAPRMDVGPRGVPSVGDPHEAVHGNLGEQLPFQGGDDEEEAGAARSTGGKADDDANFLGFSFPFVSDSILDEIQLLKQKWLPRYWGSDPPEEGEREAEEGGGGSRVLQERDTDVMRDFAAVGDTGPESARTHGHTHDVQDDGDNQIQTSSPKHDES